MNNITLELEETLKRIQTRRGIVGTIIVDNKGELIKSTVDNETSMHYAQLTNGLAENAVRCVRCLDPSNDLLVLRMGSKKKEILILPDKDFKMIVIQKETASK